VSNMTLISTDGHATARMDDYKPYMDPAFREEFDAFCDVYRELGTRNFDPPSMRFRLDPEVVDRWIGEVIEPGRLDGNWNPERRLAELESEGVAAEVLIPDFGLPFELYNPALAVAKGYPRRDQAHVDVGNWAYNRWLVDFCQTAPERFAGMASISFADVDAAIAELRWVKDAGLAGVMIPMFDESAPLYGAEFDPIWSTIEELGLVANSHIAIGSTSTRAWEAPVPAPPNAACGIILQRGAAEFYAHQILDHLIWGGLLERHPALQVVFTELGSGWIPSKLMAMDYSYDGSYLRRDIRDVIKRPPSEYFQRQCYIGSSLLSYAEVANRHYIGVDKMMVGVDYPHHEGTWNGGNINYLRATFGEAHVPEDEARRMLGETAATVFGFDLDKLAPTADRIGLQPADILTPPTEDLFPRGDVHKPLGASFT
jgi:predicted TIM-barrel fold metal-dependent hydrolase